MLNCFFPHSLTGNLLTTWISPLWTLQSNENTPTSSSYFLIGPLAVNRQPQPRRQLHRAGKCPHLLRELYRHPTSGRRRTTVLEFTGGPTPIRNLTKRNAGSHELIVKPSNQLRLPCWSVIVHLEIALHLDKVYHHSAMEATAEASLQLTQHFHHRFIMWTT